MTVSVRMDPLLERELELAAKRQGITKSQFVIDAVERALGRRNTYELMMALKAEEQQKAYGTDASAGTTELPYETDSAKNALQVKLKIKHGPGSTG
jgi:predicted DNA-binding protein